LAKRTEYIIKTSEVRGNITFIIAGQLTDRTEKFIEAIVNPWRITFIIA
jgi:hypothetical protein